jgi:hypothetical protein
MCDPLIGSIGRYCQPAFLFPPLQARNAVPIGSIMIAMRIFTHGAFRFSRDPKQ